MMSFSFRPDRRFTCLFLALVILIASLPLPEMQLARRVYDFVFIVDITRSMNTEDYREGGLAVSRLAFVKEALTKALADLPCGSRAGLGVFTERTPFLLFEPMDVCANFDALREAIQELDWRMAWAGDSQVAHGLLRSIDLVKGLQANLVFISDGQEAPPINPNYRPRFEGKPGEVKGLVIGAGDYSLSPIPKFDESGKRIGFYAADEVVHESRFGLPPAGAENRPGYNPRNAPFGGEAATGLEHLSSVREDHLKSYAAETGLKYHHLETANRFSAALQDEEFATAKPADVDIRWLPALLALALLLAAYGFDIHERFFYIGAKGNLHESQKVSCIVLAFYSARGLRKSAWPHPEKDRGGNHHRSRARQGLGRG